MKRRTFLFLFFVIVLLVITHIFFYDNPIEEIREQFDLNSEHNISTWFSTILLFCISYYSYLILQDSINDGSPNLDKWFWGIMSLAFIFLSIDEFVQIHEIFDIYKLGKWVKYYAPPTIIFSIFLIYYLFWHNKNKKFRVWMLLGFGIFVFGALILEYIAYKFYWLPFIILELEVIMEEAFELIGEVFILNGVIGYLRS